MQSFNSSLGNRIWDMKGISTTVLRAVEKTALAVQFQHRILKQTEAAVFEQHGWKSHLPR